MAQKQSKCPKHSRFGGKQLHGHSRQAYFAIARQRIAANKARRIAKDANRKMALEKKKGVITLT